MGNGNEVEKKDWRYKLFKKRYPAWIYTVALLAAALIIYFILRPYF
ncbi:MAG: hypothetical protein KAW56_13335 [Candidatus Marinimicrobia bacterium]|nr:hypothetical protein [Candidatus Neomarinimicrobiota bacterium]